MLKKIRGKWDTAGSLTSFSLITLLGYVLYIIIGKLNERSDMGVLGLKIWLSHHTIEQSRPERTAVDRIK